VGVGDLVEHQHDAAGGDVFEFRRRQRIGLGIKALVHRLRAGDCGDVVGAYSSGSIANLMLSSLNRRAAFSVASRRWKWRCGFSSAALTVCQPVQNHRSVAVRAARCATAPL